MVPRTFFLPPFICTFEYDCTWPFRSCHGTCHLSSWCQFMSDKPERLKRPRSSRQLYRGFIQDYNQRRLDNPPDAGKGDKQLDDSAKAGGEASAPVAESQRRGKRGEYLRAYLRWLWPHRFAVGAVFVFAMLVAGLEMIEPLFMRFIIDRVLLNSELDSVSRLASLNLVGAVFLTAIVLSKLIGVLKDYRQRQLNVRVMLSLRRALFDRLLHLPLPRLWDMKTGESCLDSPATWTRRPGFCRWRLCRLLSRSSVSS
jgi:ATP-binding cassette, subfamily B, bacterial